MHNGIEKDLAGPQSINRLSRSIHRLLEIVYLPVTSERALRSADLSRQPRLLDLSPRPPPPLPPLPLRTRHAAQR